MTFLNPLSLHVPFHQLFIIIYCILVSLCCQVIIFIQLIYWSSVIGQSHTVCNYAYGICVCCNCLFVCIVHYYSVCVCCNHLYCCTLTWKNGLAKCVELKLKINQSINNQIHWQKNYLKWWAIQLAILCRVDALKDHV